MSTKLFVCDAFKKYGWNGTINLEADTLKAALVTSAQVTSYSAWQANHAYAEGTIIVPTSDNGHRYICVVAGSSHATTEPTWPKSDEAQVTDNEITWEEYGGALANNAIWGDASPNEVSAGNGYTTGGATISGSVVSYSGKIGKWDANDVVWATLTKTMRYAYLYKSGTVGGVVNPLIGYLLLDDTPANFEVTGIDFTIRWANAGIYTLN